MRLVYRHTYRYLAQGSLIPALSELPLRTPPPFITCSFSLSLFPIYFSWRKASSSFSFGFVCVPRQHGSAGEPGAIAGMGGRWPVEGGSEGARSPFSWLGVACPPRHEGSMKALCLRCCCSMSENIRVVWSCKIKFKRCLFIGTNRI